MQWHGMEGRRTAAWGGPETAAARAGPRRIITTSHLILISRDAMTTARRHRPPNELRWFGRREDRHVVVASSSSSSSSRDDDDDAVPCGATRARPTKTVVIQGTRPALLRTLPSFRREANQSPIVDTTSKQMAVSHRPTERYVYVRRRGWRAPSSRADSRAKASRAAILRSMRRRHTHASSRLLSFAGRRVVRVCA